MRANEMLANGCWWRSRGELLTSLPISLLSVFSSSVILLMSPFMHLLVLVTGLVGSARLCPAGPRSLPWTYRDRESWEKLGGKMY